MAKKSKGLVVTTSISSSVIGTPERESGGGWRVRGKVDQFIEKNGKTRRLTKLAALPSLRVEGFRDDIFDAFAPDTTVTYEEESTTVKSFTGKLLICQKSYSLLVLPSK